MPEKVMLSLRSFKIECCRTLTNFFFSQIFTFFRKFSRRPQSFCVKQLTGTRTTASTGNAASPCPHEAPKRMISPCVVGEVENYENISAHTRHHARG